MNSLRPQQLPANLMRVPDFSQLKLRIQEAERKRKALEAMLEVLQSTNNFDQEDIHSVEQLLYEVLKEERALTQEYVRRDEIYKTTLQEAQRQVMERHEAMTMLNDSSEAFELFPELAQKFAKRQAEMLQRISAATVQLETLDDK